MPSPILARANALMQRHRNSNDDTDEIPILTDAVSTAEEIPLLTDIDPEEAAMPLPELTVPTLLTSPPASLPDAPATARRPDEADEAEARELLLRELARRVELRLAQTLPRLIAETLEGFLQEQAATGAPVDDDPA